MKNHLPLLLSATVVGFLALGLGLSAAGTKHPNIILLMGDDHGWEETGYNGHPFVKTPTLDAMANEGLRFDRFYAAHPSCSPTRGSVLTGRHPVRYGTFAPNWSMRPEEITIAGLLSKAGYRCGHFGKWHVGPVKATSPTNPGAMGFHQWLSHDNFFELDPQFSRNGRQPESFQGESSEILVHQAGKFIDSATQAHQPFFVVIWFGSPHEPYSGLPNDLALYDDLPTAFADKTVSLTSNATGRKTTRSLRAVLRERYAEITAMDRAIGMLRNKLDQQNLRKDTLLWYCGDNGTPPSGQAVTPLRGQKGQIYEGGIRVPGIIEWPAGIPQPKATAINAVTSDMLPTLCAITQQPIPRRALDGIDISPLFEGRLEQRPRPICFWSYDTSREASLGLKPYIHPALQEGTTPLVKLMKGKPTRTFQNLIHPTITDDDFGGSRAIMGNRFKLIVPKKGGKELYDLRADPAERYNLAASQTEIVESMSEELHRWQQSVLSSLTGADY